MVRWAGTGTYLIGMLLTAFNVFPLNLAFGALGGALWCIVGFQNRDRALITVELASAGIYLAGLLNWALK